MVKQTFEPADRPISSLMSEAVHDAPLLEQILDRAGRQGGVRLLDLGRALPSNLEHYSSFAAKIRFVDLLGQRDDGDVRSLDDQAFEHRLDELLPVCHGTFNVILTWHLIDYLGPSRTPRLIDRLTATAAPGATLHVMMTTTATMPSEPDDFVFAAGRLSRRPRTTAQTTAPGTPPATAERWLAPFRIQRSIVLRRGVRELSAALL